MKLSPDEKLDVLEVLSGLEHYRPRRKGWTWRRPVPHHALGPFVYENVSEDLARSVPLTAAILPTPSSSERYGPSASAVENAPRKLTVTAIVLNVFIRLLPSPGCPA